jgi:outer membrane protein
MMDEYEASAATMTETARKDKEEKLQKMQTDLQQFQQQAQQDIQRKEQEELKPVYDDIQTSINQIAAEQSFAFILSKDALLFASSPESDISREVLKKMNITPKNP